MSRHAALEKRAPILSAMPPSPMIQRKMAIGASHGHLEQEADRVAETVAMSRHASRLDAAPALRRPTPSRSVGAGEVPSGVRRILSSGGAPMAEPVRHDMEQSFGHNFSHVRIHADEPAQRSARALDARAYTVGDHVVFGAGGYAPESATGRGLLAHELTHVVQQAEGSALESTVQRKVEMRDVGKGEQSGFARLGELEARLNAVSNGLDFAMVGKELTYTLRKGGTLSNFDTQMMGFIDGAAVIPLRLTDRHGLLADEAGRFDFQVDGDSFNLGYVDIDDLLAGSDLGMQSLLLHILAERAATKDYAKRIGTDSLDPEFDRSHKIGIAAEVKLLRDFFSDPSIKFNAELPGPIRREYSNSRKDYIRRIIKKGKGDQTNVGGSVIEVTTRDGKKHTPEEYRDILKVAAK